MGRYELTSRTISNIPNGSYKMLPSGRKSLLNVSTRGIEPVYFKGEGVSTVSCAIDTGTGFFGMFEVGDPQASYALAIDTEAFGRALSKRLNEGYYLRGTSSPEESWTKGMQDLWTIPQSSEATRHAEIHAATLIRIVGGTAIILSASQGGFNVLHHSAGGSITKIGPSDMIVDSRSGLGIGEINDLTVGDRIILTKVGLPEEDMSLGVLDDDDLASFIASRSGPTMVASIRSISPPSQSLTPAAHRTR